MPTSNELPLCGLFLVGEAALEPIGLHDCGHSFVSLMAAAGFGRSSSAPFVAATVMARAGRAWEKAGRTDPMNLQLRPLDMTRSTVKWCSQGAAREAT